MTVNEDRQREWTEFFDRRAEEYGTTNWMITTPHLDAADKRLKDFLNRVRYIGENAEDSSVEDAMKRAITALVIGPEYPPNAKNSRAWALIEWGRAVMERQDLGALYSDSDLLRDLKESQRRAVETALYDLSGLDAWEMASEVGPVLWGDSNKALVLAKGRPTLIFGNDGSGKTTLGGLLVAGTLGLEGFGNLLGYSIAPLPEGEAVLVLSFDGHLETVANFKRLGLGRDTGRLTFFGGSPPWNPETADALTLASFVDSIERKTERKFGLVILDNAQRAFGSVDTSHRASDLGNAINRLEAQGRSVIVFAQSKKNSKPSSKDDAMLGSLGLSGMGSIISLHRTKQGDAETGQPTVTELRHHKGIGSDDAIGQQVFFDLTTGRATEDRSGPTESQAKQLAEAWGDSPEAEYTTAELADAWGVSPSRARNIANDLARHEFITKDFQRSGKAKVNVYRRGPK